MTENPNTPPDPKADQPPGGAVGEPAQPASTPIPEPASTPASTPTPTPAPTPASTPTPKSASEVAAEAAATADGPGPAGAPGPEPVVQNPATGSVAPNPWAESTAGAAGAGDAAAAEHTGDVEAGHGATAAGEYPEAAGPIGPDAPNAGVAATFLPGIDAAAVLALVVAALAAGVYLLVNPLVQAHDAARTWSDFKNNVARAKQDPFGVQRDWVSYQSWGHIILGLVAVLLALLVLALWSVQRNKLQSRAFAQAALVLGLAVVLYGILLKTGAVGSEIPSMKEISTGLSSATQ